MFVRKNISEFIRSKKKILGKINKRVQKSEKENVLSIRKGIITSKYFVVLFINSKYDYFKSKKKITLA